MTQVQMGLLMEKIVPILTSEFDVVLHDGAHLTQYIGAHFKSDEFFYDSSRVRTIELWKPNASLDQIVRIEVFDLLLEPTLAQFILDQMRIQLREWLKLKSNEIEPK